MKTACIRPLAIILALLVLIGSVAGCRAGDDVVIPEYVPVVEEEEPVVEAANYTYIDTSGWDESFVGGLLEFHLYLFCGEYLIRERAAQVTSLSFRSSGNIESLEGIQYFAALGWLIVLDNRLTSLDLSNNPELIWLDVSSNNLTALDVSNNPALQSLLVGSNNLNAIDVSSNPELIQLNVSFNNLTAIDVSNNPALEFLDAKHNNLTSLDVSNNPVLEFLDAKHNNLTSLDVSNNPVLEVLMIRGNSLTSFNVSNNSALRHLTVSENNLTSLDLSNNPELRELDAKYNYISHPDDVIGWQELELNLRPEDSDEHRWYSFIFWPQRTPTNN